MRFTACASLLGAAACLRAVEPQPANDPDLPGPLDASFADALLEHSPFTRALNLSESLLLTGVAYVDGKPVATIQDVITKKRYVVSDEPNDLGWRLAEASPSMRLDQAEVRLMIGTEIVSVRYSETQMMPQRQSSGGSSSNRIAGYDPSRPPTPEEFTGRDDKGPYVRGVPYLTEADRKKMGDIPRETRERFLNIVHDNRERLFKASHEERAGFVKRAFDAVTRR